MRLFIITQAVDPAHGALGFFTEWIRSFRMHPSVSSVTVASFDQSQEEIDDVMIRRIHSRGKWNRIRSMWILLQSSKWDVLFVHMTPLWAIACWPIVFLRRKKMVLWYTHGSSSLALRIACFLCNEGYTATNSAFPIRSKKVFAIGHGIPERFGSVERRAGNGHRYVSIGRLSPRKRIIETIEFFARIRTLDPQAMLTIIGEGTGDIVYEAEIEQTIHRLKLESCVVMKGAVLFQDLPAVYASHDVLLHLSATGSLDKVAIEALMAGCAVFSTNPATGDGLGAEWLWTGDLDDSAAVQAIGRARAGVSSETRAKVTRQYGLTSFIDRLCRMMTNLVASIPSPFPSRSKTR